MFRYSQPKKVAIDQKCNLDCMVRAVTHATKAEYSVVHKLMFKYGRRANRRRSKGEEKDQIQNTLRDLGFEGIYRATPAEKGKPRLTADAMMDDWVYQDGIYIIRVAKHVACLYEGDLLDNWNCGDKCIYFFWKIRKL